MMKMRFLMTAAAVLMCASAGSMAAAPPFAGEATLAKAVAAPSEVQVDGVTWRCEGAKCVGRAERRSTLDSQVKECRKVAAALGELTAYTSRGREMTKGSVSTCNRLAASENDEMVANK
jgi:hypothetical protein